jgi:hypothetical protein
VTYLCTDHPIYSPSAVYSAELQDDGNFVEWRGSNVLANGNTAWSLGTHTDAGGPNTVVAKMQDDGNFVVYGPNNISTPLGATNSAQSHLGNYYATLNDNGTFTINAGTPASPGSQIYSNNVNNPVVSTNVSSITYNLADQSDSLPTLLTSATQICDNRKSNIELSCTISLSLGYTETNTYTWSETSALALSLNTTAAIKMPGVTAEVSFGLTQTTTIENGKSNSASLARTYVAEGTIPVPPFSEYTIQVFGEELTGSVPFFWTGTADYKNGQSAIVDGPGIYDGSGANDFTTEVTCIYDPDGCGPVQIIQSVPEPSGALLLPVGMLAMVFASRRTSRARALDRISRSSRSWRFSRRSRFGSSRSAFVRLPLPRARVTLRLRNPVPDRLRRRLKLARQFLRRAPSAHQLNHLTAELRRIGSSALRHRGLLEHKWSAVHETGATSQPSFAPFFPAVTAAGDSPRQCKPTKNVRSRPGKTSHT